ncbi:MAG: hypothetical protein ACPG31_01810 [Planctomycetota bacterium]
MKTFRSSLLRSCAFLPLALLCGACSDSAKNGSGNVEPSAAEVASDREVEERTAEDWLALAREAATRPRSTAFTLQPGSAQVQTGTSSFEDAQHFHVETHTELMRSRPDTPMEITPITIRMACDGEELRIHLPAGAAGRETMMLLPAKRLQELPQTSPGFTLEQLDPLHFLASVLDRFTVQSMEWKGEHQVLLVGSMPGGSIADFGMGATNIVDVNATTTLLVDTQTQWVVALAINPAELRDGSLELSLPGLEAPSIDPSGWTLALPDGIATMDLASSLPTLPLQQD